jgi:RNA polymerase sigma factor (TIGR02999 family)
MRHLVADRARERLALKAGGAWDSVTLDDRAALPSIDSAEEALALDEALVALEQCNARAAQVVELRYFAGLSVDEMADALGLNRRTLHRDWRFARAFLNARLA